MLMIGVTYVRLSNKSHNSVFEMTAVKKMFGAMHFIYHINRSIAAKVDSTYLSY